MQGIYVGKASIRRGLDRFGPQGLRNGERNDHVYLQTLVSVAPDGRTAKARGVELIMSSAPGGQNGELSEGVFENTFVKQDRTWKIQSVHFYPRMIVDAAAGWAKSAKPAPGPSKEFPPDRPPTASYEIYPKFAVAPFHFDNPVTGKPPQYPEGVLSVSRPAAAAAAPASAPPIRNAADLTARLAEVERSLTAAEAYDAAENLIGAYGYYLDESPGGDRGHLRVPNPATGDRRRGGRQECEGSRAPVGSRWHFRKRRLLVGGHVRRTNRFRRRRMEIREAAFPLHVVRTLSGWLGSDSLRKYRIRSAHISSGEEATDQPLIPGQDGIRFGHAGYLSEHFRVPDAFQSQQASPVPGRKGGPAVADGAVAPNWYDGKRLSVSRRSDKA